jgi:cell division protein FtsB
MRQANRGSKLIKRPGIWSAVFLVNVIIFFFLALAFGREYVSNMQIEREIARFENERNRLEQDNLSLNNLISNLSSEYFLEKEGRTKHGLGEQGETLLVIKEDELPLTGVENTALIEQSTKRSNPQKWFHYFFGG